MTWKTMTWKTSIGAGAVVVAMAVVLLIAAAPTPASSAPAVGSGIEPGWAQSTVMPGSTGTMGDDDMGQYRAGMVGFGSHDMGRHGVDMGGDSMTGMMAGGEHRGMTDGQACPDGFEDMGGSMGRVVPGMGVASMMSGEPGPDGR